MPGLYQDAKAIVEYVQNQVAEGNYWVDNAEIDEEFGWDPRERGRRNSLVGQAYERSVKRNEEEYKQYLNSYSGPLDSTQIPSTIPDNPFRGGAKTKGFNGPLFEAIDPLGDDMIECIEQKEVQAAQGGR